MKKPNNDVIHVFTLSTFEQTSKTAPASEWENLIPKYDFILSKKRNFKKDVSYYSYRTYKSYRRNIQIHPPTMHSSICGVHL